MHRRRNGLPYWHLLSSQGDLGLHVLTDQLYLGLALGISELFLPDAMHGAYVAHEKQESCDCYFGLLQLGRRHFHTRRCMHMSIARHAVPVWRLTSTCCN